MIPEDVRILRKERLEPFLEGLLQDHVVFAPTRKGEFLFLNRIASARDVALEDGKTKNSAKDALFPQRERMFAYQAKEGKVEIDASPPAEEKQILFGIRPCDARGLLLLDAVFGGACRDPYYADKRAGTLVISMACVTPGPSCFCLSLGGGPCSIEGSDLALLDLGDRYLVEAPTEKGRAFLQDPSFEDADRDARAGAEEIRKEAESSMNPAVVGEALQERLEQSVDDPLWGDLTESCLSCGVCTYLCPTCHCFDICDEAAAMTGERIRIWDSCQFPLFTREASGHNPRPSGKERFRQRIMHKFSYLPKSRNMAGCVGCGRCVTECPVNLDIREVLEKISQAEAR
jgi:ferredoxin